MKLFHYRAVEEATNEWAYWRDDARAASCAGHGAGELHATAALAVDCYRQYLLDNHLDLNVQTLGLQQYCVGSPPDNFYTDQRAKIDAAGGGEWFLCDNHRTRAVVEGLLDYLDDMKWQF